MSLLLTVAVAVSAQTINWNNPAGGTFNVGSNWAGGVVPGPSNHAAFALNNNYTVTFNNSPANSNLIMSAGTTTFAASGAQLYTLGGFASFTGGTHTVTGMGMDVGVALRPGGNANITFNGGSDVTTTSLGFFGAGASTLTFSGAGTTFRADNSLGLSSIGGTGVTALMDFISSSDGTFSGVLNVGTALTGSTSGTLRVAGGAEVRAQRAVTVGASGQSGQAGTLTLTGATTRFIQTGGEAFTVGAAAGSAGSIIVGADLTTGTGLFTVNPSGTLLISGLGGRLINGGSVLFNGGGFASMDGSQWSVAGTLDASAGEVVMQRGTVSAQSILGAENFTWNVDSGFAGLTVNGGSLSCGSFHYDLHTTVPNGGQVQLRLINGASFDLAGELTVGGQGTAFLNVESGSSLECGILTVQTAASAVTSVLVSGAGSTIVADDLTLGSGPQPILPVTLRIENGGAVTVGDSFGSGIVSIRQWGMLDIAAGGTFTFLGGGLFGQTVDENSSLIRLDGGTLDLAEPQTLAGYTQPVIGGKFDFLGGTIIFREDSEMDSPSLQAMFGAARTLGFGKSVQVMGTATFTSALTLDGGSLSVGALVNGHHLQLLRGTLAINSGSLLIGPGGQFGQTLSLPGGMNVSANSVSVAPDSLLHLDGARVSAAGSIANSGEILLRGGVAQLDAASFTNRGLISGNGRIAARLINESTGLVRAGADDHLRFEGSSNTNDGSINLLGGVVEFTAGPLVNSIGGRVLGRGSLIAPMISNDGSMIFSGGTSDVQGDLLNSSTSRVTVTGGSQTTFYDDVTNGNGSVFRVAEASVAVFLGNVSGLGAFTGDGVKIFEGSASNGPLGSGGGSTIVEQGAGVTTTHVRESALKVRGNVNILPNGTPAGTSRVQQLEIVGGAAPVGRLDMSNNDLVIDYSGPSPLMTVADQIHSGWSGGNWSGNGIATSSGDASSFGIGYAESSAIFTTFPATFSGQSVDDTSVLIAFTRYGDANLDGQVNLQDFNRLASNFGTSGGAVWSQGDFTYDGTVNLQDFNRLASNFGLGAGPDGVVDPQDWAALSAAVPEPAHVGLLVALLPLSGRRARRRGWRSGAASEGSSL